MTTLKRGDRGAAVELLQGVLQKLGYDISAPDGIFGGETVEQVKAFQSNVGLDEDGVFGPDTASAMIAELLTLDMDS